MAACLNHLFQIK